MNVTLAQVVGTHELNELACMLRPSFDAMQRFRSGESADLM